MTEAEVIFYYLTEDIRLRQCRWCNAFPTDTVGYEVTDKERDLQHDYDKHCYKITPSTILHST